MLGKRIRVLKKDQIRQGSPVCLPAGQAAVAGELSEDHAGGVTVGPAQARIVESNSDYVILEMICGCGKKSFVQCNYGNVAGTQDLQETRS